MKLQSFRFGPLFKQRFYQLKNLQVLKKHQRNNNKHEKLCQNIFIRNFFDQLFPEILLILAALKIFTSFTICRILSSVSYYFKIATYVEIVITFFYRFKVKPICEVWDMTFEILDPFGRLSDFPLFKKCLLLFFHFITSFPVIVFPAISRQP